MGGRDNRKLVSFRATDDEVAAIERLVKASGLSKQEYLLRAALENISSHTHFADGSIKTSDSSSLMLIAAGDSSQTKTLKGIEAKKAIYQGVKVKLLDEVKLLYFDGWLWLMSKTANGSQDVITSYLKYPSNLAQGLFNNHDQRSLEEVHAALEFYNILESTSDICGDGWLNGDVAAIFYMPEKFKKEHIEKIAQARQTLAAIAEEPSPIEIVNEGIAIKAIEEPTSPLNEVVEKTQLELIELPKQLSHKELRAMYSLDDDKVFSCICERARANGYVAHDGKTWYLEGVGKKAIWSTIKVAVAV